MQQFVFEAFRLRRRYRPGLGEFAVASTHQRPLQTHRLVEGQPIAGPPPLGLALAKVDGPQSLVFRYQIVRGTEFFRQRVGNRIEHLEYLPDAVEDVPTL